MRNLCALVLISLAALAGCGTEEAEVPFAQRDPNGYEACSYVAQYDDARGPTKMGISATAGEAASKSGTKAIRETSNSLLDEETAKIFEGTEAEGVDLYLAKMDDLQKACEAQGFE